ncbi:MAG: hypothetical protein OXI81_01425 [Paracoccaceae bacterium]|nr:hypothetical protein [Paracoccaceae bacterium]
MLRKDRSLLLTILANDAPFSLPSSDATTFPLDALWPKVTTQA